MSRSRRGCSAGAAGTAGNHVRTVAGITAAGALGVALHVA